MKSKTEKLLDGGLCAIVLILVLLACTYVGAQTSDRGAEENGTRYLDLPFNGRFEDGFVSDDDGDAVPVFWDTLETNTSGETSILSGVLDNGPSYPGSWSLHWSRTNGGVDGAWTACQQVISVVPCKFPDPSRQVFLDIDIKAISHNLGGSGWMEEDFEYPVTLKVEYVDTEGTARYWQWGWWIWIDDDTRPNPDHKPVPSNGVVTGDSVLANVWVQNTFNLSQELSNPAEITKIIVGGAGWDFEGQADNIVLRGCYGDVPSLTGWGMLVLAVFLVASGAWVVMKRRRMARVRA